MYTDSYIAHLSFVVDKARIQSSSNLLLCHLQIIKWKIRNKRKAHTLEYKSQERKFSSNSMLLSYIVNNNYGFQYYSARKIK